MVDMLVSFARLVNTSSCDVVEHETKSNSIHIKMLKSYKQSWCKPISEYINHLKYFDLRGVSRSDIEALQLWLEHPLQQQNETYFVLRLKSSCVKYSRPRSHNVLYFMLSGNQGFFKICISAVLDGA